MSELLEKYELETIEDLYEAIVMAVNRYYVLFAREIYQDIIDNNLMESFKTWYEKSQDKNQTPFTSFINFLNSKEIEQWEK